MSGTSIRRPYDFVVCSHSGAFESTLGLLPQLKPYGRVHLVSSFLQPKEIRALEPWFDVLHEPKHDEDGYRNFALFCIRDLNRVVTAPYFAKVDTDVILEEGWIEYVDETLEAFLDVVLFGPHSGTNRLDYHMSGSHVRNHLGRPLKVRDGLKVNGSFYVGRTAFFQEHDRTMQLLHDCLYAFRDGRRVRESHVLSRDDLRRAGEIEEVVLRGCCRGKQESAIEDDLRSLLVHFVGGPHRLLVRDSDGRIRVPDKARAPSPIKLAVKSLKRIVGIREYASTRHAT